MKFKSLFFLLAITLIPGRSYARSGLGGEETHLRVCDESEAVCVDGVSEIKFEDTATVTDNGGGSVSISDIGGGGSGGWTDDGTTVRLTASTDNVSIGADAEPGSEKLQVTGSTRTTGEFIEGTGTTTAGVFGLTQAAKTASFTADNSTSVYLCDATSGAITVTLPAASGATNRIYHIKKTDSSANAVVVDGSGSETVDGGTTATISAQFESIQIICDGSNWHIL